MDLLRNKNFLSGMMWLVCVVGMILAGCQLFVSQQNWNTKWGPLVPHTNFPGDCSICHLQERWDKLREDFTFDHEKETGYRLEGSHAAAACLRCHNDRGPVQVYTARGCAGCHMDPHTATLGVDCESCHSQLNWQPVGLVGEHAATRFPLMGAHAIASCESCHEGAAAGQFRGAPLQCEICHQEELAMAANPNHGANGWITDCERCHQPSGWQGAYVNHDFFPLVGGHTALDCAQCHTVPGIFSGLSQDCYSCHATDFRSAPGHVENNYSRDCQECHSISAWTPAHFDHSFFPLTGQHAPLDCSSCHVGGVYTGLSQECNACHNTDYQSAPNHLAGNYPRSCEQCHATTGWQPATFDHSAFALTAGHAGLACSACHSGGVYSGIPSDCYSCHAANYQTAPNHVPGNYSMDCEQCHSTTAWVPAAFDHSAFALTAGHSGLACSACHSGGVYSGLPSDCYSCHAANYQTAPNHVPGNYSMNCEQCHTTTAWAPATFDHSAFALVGGHAGLDCTQCHVGGVYTGTPSDCYSCHAADYQGASDHASLNLSRNCEQCHSVNQWTPSSFSHPFPLRGDHNASCITCHDAGNAAVFTCFNCHEHIKSETDKEHKEVSGYSYNAAACYTCHPSGKE